MPEIEPNILTSLRRGAVGFGRALRPAIGPLAVGGAAYLGFKGLSGTINAYAAEQNPPAQTGTIPYGPNPNDGQGREGYFFDPRTGRTFLFGAPPTGGNGPDRSTERTTNYLILAGAAALVAIAFLRR